MRVHADRVPGPRRLRVRLRSPLSHSELRYRGSRPGGGAEPGARLYRQVRVPLLSIAAGRRGMPLYLTVDFVVVRGDGSEEWIHAKTRRRSREWIRGRAAAEAWLGAPVAEVDR